MAGIKTYQLYTDRNWCTLSLGLGLDRKNFATAGVQLRFHEYEAYDAKLAVGLWSNEAPRAICLTDRIEARAVYINDDVNALPQSPVSGYKPSSYGRKSSRKSGTGGAQTPSKWLARKSSPPASFNQTGVHDEKR